MPETTPQPEREGPWMRRPELLGRLSHKKRIDRPEVKDALNVKFGEGNWRHETNNQGLGHVETFVENRGSEEETHA